MQTTIFDQLIDQRANDLLDALNDGRKPKDMFLPQYCFKEGTKSVYIASNKEKQVVFNVLDENGNTPDGFSANWRTLPHILDDLKIKKFTNA